MVDRVVDELRNTLAEIGTISMDAPVLVETIEQARALAERVESIALSPFTQTHLATAKAILQTIASCLRSAADGHVLFVYVVPLSLSAGTLLTQPERCTSVALTGALFELETLLPIPGAEQMPDVPLDSLTKARDKSR